MKKRKLSLAKWLEQAAAEITVNPNVDRIRLSPALQKRHEQDCANLKKWGLPKELVELQKQRAKKS